MPYDIKKSFNPDVAAEIQITDLALQEGNLDWHSRPLNHLDSPFAG